MLLGARGDGRGRSGARLRGESRGVLPFGGRVATAASIGCGGGFGGGKHSPSAARGANVLLYAAWKVSAVRKLRRFDGSRASSRSRCLLYAIIISRVFASKTPPPA